MKPIFVLLRGITNNDKLFGLLVCLIWFYLSQLTPFQLKMYVGKGLPELNQY